MLCTLNFHNRVNITHVLNTSLKQDKSRKGKRSKGCLFSVIVDGMLENTHLMGCSGTDSLHPEKQGKDKKIYTTETTPEGWEAFEHRNVKRISNKTW